MQNLVSIQPRTSLVKFARSAYRSPRFAAFANPFAAAALVPELVSCLPIGATAVSLFFEWSDLAPPMAYGPLANVWYSQKLVDLEVWFAALLVVDLVIITVHGLGSLETYVHHVIFGGLGALAVRSCAMPLVAAALLAQEVSTPLQKAFLLTRAFHGPDSSAAQILFVAFAALFFCFRVLFNALVTATFLWYWGSRSARVLAYRNGIPMWEQAVIPLGLLAGFFMQCYWFGIILSRLKKMFFNRQKKAN